MTQKALIVGGSGFVGKHLTDRLLRQYAQVHITKLAQEEVHAPQAAKVHELDIQEQQQIESLLTELQPDVIFHLAAVSSVALSWKKPELTINVNVLGTLHLLEAARAVCPQTRVLLIGSGEEYGAIAPSDVPVKETFRLAPQNIYALSKVTQDYLGEIYARAYGMNVIRVRAFNHIGVGQLTGFIIPDFCSQIAMIEAGQRPAVIYVGNLLARRDYLDVRDVVEAYALLAQKGVAGKVYNIGSGRAIGADELLTQLLALAELPIAVESDPGKIRPVDVPVVFADISILQQDTGWSPTHHLDETLKEILDDWRIKVRMAAKAAAGTSTENVLKEG